MKKEDLLTRLIKEVIYYELYNKENLFFENKNIKKVIGKNKFFNFINRSILVPIALNSFAINTGCESPQYVIDKVEQTSPALTSQDSNASNTENEDITIVNDEGVKIFNIEISEDTIREIKKLDNDQGLKNKFKKYFRVNKYGEGKLKKAYAKLTIAGKDFYIIKGSINIRTIKKILTRLKVDKQNKIPIIEAIKNTMSKNSATQLAAFVYGNIMVVGSSINYYTFAHEFGHLIHLDEDRVWREKTYQFLKFFNENGGSKFSDSGIAKEDIPEHLSDVFNYYLTLEGEWLETTYDGKYVLGFDSRMQIKKHRQGKEEADATYDYRKNEGIEYSNAIVRTLVDLLKRHEEQTIMNILRKMIELKKIYKDNHYAQMTHQRELWAEQNKGRCKNTYSYNLWFLTHVLELPKSNKIKQIAKESPLEGIISIFYSKVYEGNHEIRYETLEKLVNKIKESLK